MSEENKINGLRIGNARVSDLLNTAIKRVDGVAVNTTAFSTGLLDTYGSAAAAYSVRRLNSSYTGACMRVRESGGNTETDIGFNSAGNLDVLAIRDHCGSSSGYVRYWYDQSTAGGTGSGNDAGQATSLLQPVIYNGTAVITENGKPAVQFDGSNDALHALYSTSSSEDFALSRFQVIETATTSGNQTFTSLSDSTATDPIRSAISLAGNYGFYNRDDSGTIATSSSAQSAIQALMTVTDTGTVGNVYYNASQIVTNASTDLGVTTIDKLSLGTFREFSPTNYLNGHLQEVIFYNSDQDAAGNRTGIETDINTYFSIY